MPKCGFGVLKTFEGEKNFDKYYIDREVKKVARKTGEGPEDYVIEDKVIENKRDIKQTIMASLGDAGIDAYLAPYLKTNTEVPGAVVDDTIQDFSQMPENLAEAAALGENAKALYSKLDPKLTGGLSMEDFLNTLTPEKLEAYYKSLIPQDIKNEVKTEVKTEVKENV